jgi:hypothetical protein
MMVIDLPSLLRALSAASVRCHCIDLVELIRVKRAVGRPKDFEAIAELEAIAEENRRS